MKRQIQLSLALCSFVFCLSTALSTHLIAKSLKTKANSSIDLEFELPPPEHVFVAGPTGPTGPVGPQGERGEKGTRGECIGFDPVYASVHVTYDPVKVVTAPPGEKIVPFDSIGQHSDGVLLNGSRITLPSGVYTASYKMTITGTPAIYKMFVRLYPSAGPHFDQYINRVHSQNTTAPKIHPYYGEGLIEIPDDTSYEIALIFDKTDSLAREYKDYDVFNYLPSLVPCYPATMILEKIAEYSAP